MLKNIFILASGTAISQVVVLIATPVLSRIYTPSEFGQFAIIMSVLVVLAPFSTLRYETAILIKENGYPKSSLLILSMALIVFSSLVFYLFIPSVGRFLGVALIETASLVLVGMFFISAAGETLVVWHISERRFRVAAIGKFIQATSTVSMQIFFASKFGVLGLIYGYFVGAIFAFVFYSWEFMRKDAGSIEYLKSISYMGVAAAENKNFPIYSVWATVLNGVVNQLPIILFGNLFSSVVTGNYEMARRLSRAPLNLVGQAIFRVVSQYIGELAEDKKKSVSVLEAIFFRMTIYSLIPILVIVIFLDDGFAIVLGDQWSRAGIYAQVISPWLFALFLSWPLTSAYNTFGYQAQLIVFNLVFILGFLLAFSAHVYLGFGDLYVLIVMSVLSTLARLWYCYWILNKCGSVNLMSKFVPIILIFILLGFVIYLEANGVINEWV